MMNGRHEKVKKECNLKPEDKDGIKGLIISAIVFPPFIWFIYWVAGKGGGSLA